MHRSSPAFVAALASLIFVIQAQGQTSVSAEGVIESKSGGFKFPDGTVQLSASDNSLVNEVCSLYSLTGNPAPQSLITESPETTCDDGIDNDCDNAIDCLDIADCAQIEVCACNPDAYEPNETGLQAYDLGTLSDTAGGGGGHQNGLGQHCNHHSHIVYGINEFGEVEPLDRFDDSTDFFVEVKRDPAIPPSCRSYVLTVSNGPVGYEQVVTVIGTIEPDGDSDWYTFFALDEPEGETALDSWRVEIKIDDGSSAWFYIKVYEGGFYGQDQLCPWIQ